MNHVQRYLEHRMCLQIVEDTFIIWKPDLNNLRLLSPIEVHLAALKKVIRHSETKVQLFFSVDHPLYAATDMDKSWESLELKIEFFQSSNCLSFKTRIVDIMVSRGFHRPEEEDLANVKMSVSRATINLGGIKSVTGKPVISRATSFGYTSSMSPPDSPIKPKMSVTKNYIHVTEQNQSTHRSAVPSFSTRISSFNPKKKFNSMDDEFWDFPDTDMANAVPSKIDIRQETSNHEKVTEPVRPSEKTHRNVVETPERKKPEVKKTIGIRKPAEKNVPVRKTPKAKQAAKPKAAMSEKVSRPKKIVEVKKGAKTKEVEKQVSERRAAGKQVPGGRKAAKKQAPVAKETAASRAIKSNSDGQLLIGVEKNGEENTRGKALEEAESLRKSVDTQKAALKKSSEDGIDNEESATSKGDLNKSARSEDTTSKSNSTLVPVAVSNQLPTLSENRQTRALKRQKRLEESFDEQSEPSSPVQKKQKLSQESFKTLDSFPLDDLLSISMEMESERADPVYKTMQIHSDEQEDSGMEIVSSIVVHESQPQVANKTTNDSPTSDIPASLQEIRIQESASLFEDIIECDVEKQNLEQIQRKAIPKQVKSSHFHVESRDELRSSPPLAAGLLSPAVLTSPAEAIILPSIARTPSPIASSPSPIARTPSPIARSTSPKARTPSPIERSPSPAVGIPLPIVRNPPPVVRIPLPTVRSPPPAVSRPAVSTPHTSRYHANKESAYLVPAQSFADFAKLGSTPVRPTAHAHMSVQHDKGDVGPLYNSHGDPTEFTRETRAAKTSDSSRAKDKLNSYILPETTHGSARQYGQRRDAVSPETSVTLREHVMPETDLPTRIDSTTYSRKEIFLRGNSELNGVAGPEKLSRFEFVRSVPKLPVHGRIAQSSSNEGSRLPWETSRSQIEATDRLQVQERLSESRDQAQLILKGVTKSIVKRLEAIETEMFNYEAKYWTWFRQEMARAEGVLSRLERDVHSLHNEKSEKIKASKASCLSWIKEHS